MGVVQLKHFNNSWYKTGAGKLKMILWFYTNAVFFKTSLVPVSSFKVALLKLFGAKMGKGIVVKPCVNIKYPWRLTVGDYTWIGENVWIDNLENVHIGKNACISQGAYLLTGNHNFTSPTFDLIAKGIILEDGAWIGAFSIVCPGVTCGSHALLAVSSVATGNLQPYGIYRGNPAVKIKERIIND
jgi:putative colanic acid biosynthesis acetyltransferase WcaF